jgi:hypothetical protein
LLSWDRQGTFCLSYWEKDSHSRYRIRWLKTASKKDAVQLHPDWLGAQAELYNPSLIQCGFVGWEEERVAGISPQLPQAGYAAIWHTDADTTARHLLPDGTFVVTLASGQICFLKLYHGNQRTDLDALRQLMLPADA